jgi:Ca2+-transporting ATPase
MGIKDPLRPEVIDAIDRCKGAGIGVMMVTGDSMLFVGYTDVLDLHTAIHIGTECGIYDPGRGIALEGKQFREMNTEQRLEVLSKLQVLARSTPMDKHLLVTSYKQIGHIVSVTGDGTNDHFALRAANVGLSMGSGTEIAKEASDIGNHFT